MNTMCWILAPSSPQNPTHSVLQWNALYVKADSDDLVKQDIRVVIAGDDTSSVSQLSQSLAREGFSCETSPTRESVLSIVRKDECDVVICALRMHGMYDFDLLDRMKALQPHVPIIVGAAVGSISEAIDAIKRGAYQYLVEPLNVRNLAACLLEAIADSRQYRGIARTSQPAPGELSGELVHESSIMRELVDSIALVARSSAPVLVLGESGTGKERVARAIHAGGARAGQPFVAVNTAAIPDTLLESEVFGHVRGAFTGASQARRGLLLEASGGTLLLDEIGDMPILLQSKLLRVLQFGETRPVGSDRFGHVDVRVIAATHRDLDVLVREGRFREDLRFRLNVLPLVVPPLRERRNDIIPLAIQFLADARKRTVESPVERIGDEAMEILRRAPWPGNVRELENTIERLVVLGRKPEVAALDLAFLQAQPPKHDWFPVEGSLWTLKEMNRRYLDVVLARTRGDKVRAAGILGIDLSTLYRWAHAKR